MDDLRDIILTNDAARRMLNRVSPIYEDSFVGLWLYEIMGREFQAIWDTMDDFPNQFYPETATWSLPYWEQRYGLIVDESLSTEARRQRVIDARDKSGRANNYRIETWLAEKSGAEVEVIDNVDDFTFAITLATESHLLPTFDINEAIAYINKRKPSHLSYVFRHMIEKNIDIYVGIALYGIQIQDFGTTPQPNFDEEELLADGLGDYLADGRGIVMTC